MDAEEARADIKEMLDSHEGSGPMNIRYLLLAKAFPNSQPEHEGYASLQRAQAWLNEHGFEFTETPKPTGYSPLDNVPPTKVARMPSAG